MTVRVQILMTKDDEGDWDFTLRRLRSNQKADLSKGPVFKVKPKVATRWMRAQESYYKGDYEPWWETMEDLSRMLPEFLEFEK